MDILLELVEFEIFTFYYDVRSKSVIRLSINLFKFLSVSRLTKFLLEDRL